MLVRNLIIKNERIQEVKGPVAGGLLAYRRCGCDGGFSARSLTRGKPIDDFISRSDVTEIDAEIDQRGVVFTIVMIRVAIADHRRPEIEQHRVARGAFAACVRRRAADPDGNNTALT
jgi:hypothetical protein